MTKEHLDPSPIGFRPLAMSDMRLMHLWLNTDVVRQWYKEPSAYDELVALYSPMIRHEEPTHGFIILYDETPIGFIQTYLICDHPDYAAAVQVDEKAAGVDLFIGEPEYMHRGLGSAILTKFLAEIVWTLTGASCCVIGPEPNNMVAIRAYEKAGFIYLKTVVVPGEDEPEYLMQRRKSAR